MLGSAAMPQTAPPCDSVLTMHLHDLHPQWIRKPQFALKALLYACQAGKGADSLAFFTRLHMDAPS